MSQPKLPKTDSIQALAEFWDKHDLTDFEHELEEVEEMTSSEMAELKIRLEATDRDALRRLAESSGLSDVALVRRWILERLNAA